MASKEEIERLKKLLASKTKLNETNMSYGAVRERMLPKIESDLKKRRHSLGDHPAFPASDETTFEQKIIGKRFGDVVDGVKRHFNTDEIDLEQIMHGTIEAIVESRKIERLNKKALEELAVKMIREEYDMGADDVDIIVELVDEVDLEGTRLNESPLDVSDMEFDSHDDIESASGEVYKRRFINAMIQGAAKKCNHMFHQVDEELTMMDPKLITQYNRMMSGADYTYYAIDKMEKGLPGGVVRVELPKNEGEKPIIHAQAIVFPVLIHELVKGVMELLSSHGLPEDPKMREYVIAKADFLSAEPWDMRLGPGIWEKITEGIDADDFKIKHHIYSELCALPVNEFNKTIKEIMAGTKAGKSFITELAKEINSEMKIDEQEKAIRDISVGDDGMSPDDLDNLTFDDFL